MHDPLTFEQYLREVCLRLGFRASIEEFRKPVQFYWDANLSVGYATRLMRDVLDVQRVH